MSAPPRLRQPLQYSDHVKNSFATIDPPAGARNVGSECSSHCRVLAQAKWKKWHKDAQEQIKVYQQREQSGEFTVFRELIPANRLVVERRWDEARQELERIRARRPDDWQVRYRIAYFEFARGDYDQAYIALSQIVNNNPPGISNWIKANSMLSLARVFDIRGQRADAIKLYKRVIDDYEDEDAADNARYGLLTPYSARKGS